MIYLKKINLINENNKEKNTKEKQKQKQKQKKIATKMLFFYLISIIFFGDFSSSFLGIVIFKIPFSKVASILSLSIPPI